MHNEGEGGKSDSEEGTWALKITVWALQDDNLKWVREEEVEMQLKHVTFDEDERVCFFTGLTNWGILRSIIQSLWMINLQ